MSLGGGRPLPCARCLHDSGSRPPSPHLGGLFVSALPLGLGLADVMALPSAPGISEASGLLDLIPKEVRTTARERCPKTFGMTGILGRWAILVQIPCQQWACPVCGQ